MEVKDHSLLAYYRIIQFEVVKMSLICTCKSLFMELLYEFAKLLAHWNVYLHTYSYIVSEMVPFYKLYHIWHMVLYN